MFPYDIALPILGPLGIYIFFGTIAVLGWAFGGSKAPKEGSAQARVSGFPAVVFLLAVFGLILPFFFTPIGTVINIGGQNTIAEQGISEILKAPNWNQPPPDDLMDLTGAMKLTVTPKSGNTAINGTVEIYTGKSKELSLAEPAVTITNGDGLSARDDYTSGQSFILKIISGNAVTFWPTPWTLEQVKKGTIRTTFAVSLKILPIDTGEFDISVYIEGTNIANYDVYNVTTEAKPYPTVTVTFRTTGANEGFEEYMDYEQGWTRQMVATLRRNGTDSDNAAFKVTPAGMIEVKGTTDDHTWAFPVGSLYLLTDSLGAEKLDSKSSVEKKIQLDTSGMSAGQEVRYEVNLRAGTNLQYLDDHTGAHPSGNLNLKDIIWYVDK